MGDVNFYLKKAEANGKSAIFLQYKYDGKRFKYYFKQSIEPRHWNSNKQRVKSNKITTADGQHSLNDLLDNLKKELLSTYRKELADGIPPKATLKAALDDFINQNKENPDGPTLYKLIDRFITGEIKHKGREKSPNTIKTYKTTLSHLKAFEKVVKWKIEYNTIDLDFLYKYITFLRTEFSEAVIKKYDDPQIQKSLKTLPIGQNAIAKDVQIIKTFMKKAVTLKETNNLWFQHEEFTATRIETDSVYLTESEIINLYKYDLSTNKRFEQVRDLFVFGCFVGLRYSDYSTVKPENIVKLENRFFIKMRTTKTGQLVVIPCNPIVLQIFKKYDHNPNKLPKSLSNQKFNNTIKEVCKKAGMTEKGRLSTKPEQPLHDCITSHTARRSFATNVYLSGFPVLDLMKITGHTTEKAFYKYIRHTKIDAAKRLDEHMQKRWSEILLKVA